MQHKNSGFTLIEISIVLLIIGLLAAGILVGRDLIRAAEIRAQVAQILEFTAAVNTFRNKYQCLPGDCPQAEEFDLGDNGNGDGALNPAYPSLLGSEMIGFWDHLSSANLVPRAEDPDSLSPGIGTPALKFRGNGPLDTRPGNNPGDPPVILNQTKGGWWVAPAEITRRTPMKLALGGNAWFLTATALNGTMVGIYLPFDAYSLDSKLDDGFPMSGKFGVVGNEIRICPPGLFACFDQFQPTTTTSNPGNPTVCVDDTVNPPQYNMQVTVVNRYSVCAPVIAGGF